MPRLSAVGISGLQAGEDVKGYSFEVSTQVNDKQGVALADQVKSLDWGARRAKKAGAVELIVLDEVLAKLEALLVPMGS